MFDGTETPPEGLTVDVNAVINPDSTATFCLYEFGVGGETLVGWEDYRNVNMKNGEINIIITYVIEGV